LARVKKPEARNFAHSLSVAPVLSKTSGPRRSGHRIFSLIFNAVFCIFGFRFEPRKGSFGKVSRKRISGLSGLRTH